jgi:hypothetical protein
MFSTHARTALAALLVVSGAVACSEPGVKPRPPDLQGTASNVRDWDAAAHRLVVSMVEQGFLPSAHLPPPGRRPFPAPYYVNVTSEGSTFLEVVRESIEKELLYRNLPVARAPVGATVINLSVDVVQWGSDVPYSGGALTALGLAGIAGAGLASAAPLSAPAWAAIGAGAAAGVDVGLSMVPNSRTELVWRASIINGDYVLMKGSEILYVSGADLPLYLGSGAHQSIASPGVALLGPARPLQYAR